MNLAKFLEGRGDQLGHLNLRVTDLEQIQDLMADDGSVSQYLRVLADDMTKRFAAPEQGAKYTRALGATLGEEERSWMPGGATKEVIPATAGQEKNEKFLGRLQKGNPLKDVGAAISHGEHAHRIQWFIISRWVRTQSFDHPDYMGRVYKALTTIVPMDSVAGNFSNIESLWAAVIDIPGQHPLKTNEGDVRSGAPVDLTTAISGGNKVGLSQLQMAILNRRVKRYLEVGAYWHHLLRIKGQDLPSGGRTSKEWREQAKKNMEGNEAAKEFVETFPLPFGRTDVSLLDSKFGGLTGPLAPLLDRAYKLMEQGVVLGYDGRNALAFGLAGIEPSPQYIDFCIEAPGSPLKLEGGSWKENK